MPESPEGIRAAGGSFISGGHVASLARSLSLSLSLSELTSQEFAPEPELQT